MLFFAFFCRTLLTVCVNIILVRKYALSRNEKYNINVTKKAKLIYVAYTTYLKSMVGDEKAHDPCKIPSY